MSKTSIGILDFFKNTKNAPILKIFGECGWLANLSFSYDENVKMKKFYNEGFDKELT